MASLNQESLDVIFNNAHTEHGFTADAVSDETLKAIYDSLKWGPTAFNCSPLRIYFVKSKEEKEKLSKCLAPGNVAQTMAAPVTAIIGYDAEWLAKMGELSPNYDVKPIFEANPSWVEPTMVRNGTLQGAYFIIAARAHGLGCGPMSGFDNGAVDSAFFEGTAIKSNFLVNIGTPDTTARYPRAPRLAFEDACKIL
jgi:3-hydroxypropanoate dehydrogenase